MRGHHRGPDGRRPRARAALGLGPARGSADVRPAQAAAARDTLELLRPGLAAPRGGAGVRTGAQGVDGRRRLERRERPGTRARTALGSRGDSRAQLESWARDGALGVAVRREAVRAIAYGWVFNRLEPLYGLSRERASSLEALALLDLPAPVAAAVREGQAEQRFGVGQRFARSFEYRMARDAAAGL